MENKGDFGSSQCCQPLEKEGKNKDRGRRIWVLLPLVDCRFEKYENGKCDDFKAEKLRR